MYSNFAYYAPTKVLFGEKTEAEVGDLVKASGGKKVLIHYGGSSAEASGLLARIRESLGRSAIAFVELGGVVPNPHLSKVYEGITLCKEQNVDFILAVGGGSVIDSAKAIGYGVANEGDVWDLFTGARSAAVCLPIGVVLTIAAAGSEMSNGCVITNAEHGLKRAYDDDLSRPVFAVMNPELTMTLPPYQTASGAADILMHTMERYFNLSDNMEITDTISEAVLTTVMHYTRQLMAEPQNYKARAEVMWAGSLSHNGLTGCGTGGGDWACHVLEHEMGGMFDVAHGAGLAAIWSSWARYVNHAAPERFVKFATHVMGVAQGDSDSETIESGIRAMENFYREIQMPTSMKELGIEPTDEQIEKMARSCAQAVGGAAGSVVPLHTEDMVRIYKAAR